MKLDGVATLLKIDALVLYQNCTVRIYEFKTVNLRPGAHVYPDDEAAIAEAVLGFDVELSELTEIAVLKIA